MNTGSSEPADEPKRLDPVAHLFIAATSPFTIVTFDSDDEPGDTLEEVNKLTYDSVKLCRTTMALDPMLPAMKRMAVIVSYTGALLFPRMKGISFEAVIESANRLLLKLTFGGIPFDVITPSDVGYGMIYKTGYFLTGGGAAGPNYSKLMSLQHRDAGVSDAMSLLHPRICKASEIKEALNKGGPVVDELPQINPSIFLNGLTSFRLRQFEVALVFLWSTCEAVIGRLWDDHVVPKGAGIVGRKRFVEGNGWQAAHMVEVLFQLGLIDDALYSEISEARSARNALAHRGDAPSLENCKAALNAAFGLVSMARSSGATAAEFTNLADSLSTAHDPKTGPIQPKYWKHLPSVPGDGTWRGPYPAHPEIELVPIIDVK